MCIGLLFFCARHDPGSSNTTEWYIRKSAEIIATAPWRRDTTAKSKIDTRPSGPYELSNVGYASRNNRSGSVFASRVQSMPKRVKLSGALNGTTFILRRIGIAVQAEHAVVVGRGGLEAEAGLPKQRDVAPERSQRDTEPALVVCDADRLAPRE
jgi:hypothetical protein